MEPPVSYNQTCLTVFLTFKDSQIVHFQNAICRIDTTAKYVNRTLHSFSDGVLWVLNISCFHIKKIVYKPNFASMDLYYLVFVPSHVPQQFLETNSNHKLSVH